jgi:hypothetical protein
MPHRRGGCCSRRRYDSCQPVCSPGSRRWTSGLRAAGTSTTGTEPGCPGDWRAPGRAVALLPNCGRPTRSGVRVRTLVVSSDDARSEPPAPTRPQGPGQRIMSQTRGLARTPPLHCPAALRAWGTPSRVVVGCQRSALTPPSACSSTHQAPFTGADQAPPISCDLIRLTGPT